MVFFVCLFSSPLGIWQADSRRAKWDKGRAGCFPRMTSVHDTRHIPLTLWRMMALIIFPRNFNSSMFFLPSFPS